MQQRELVGRRVLALAQQSLQPLEKFKLSIGATHDARSLATPSQLFA